MKAKRYLLVTELQNRNFYGQDGRWKIWEVRDSLFDSVENVVTDDVMLSIIHSVWDPITQPIRYSITDSTKSFLRNQNETKTIFDDQRSQ